MDSVRGPAEARNPERSGVGVIDKSVAVLDALAVGPASLAELVATTGLARPTVHRLARALEHHDLVARTDDGRFRLGLRLMAWGRDAAGSLGLVEAARPVLAELRDRTEESAQLYVREGDRRVCVAAAERPTGLRDTVPVGAALPLDAGSGATVIRVWGPDGTSGDGGLRGPERERIRHQGWAASVGEREEGVASVSAPVLDGDRLVAVISVSGPIDRLGQRPGDRFAVAVVEAARDLERRLRRR